jgi:restriction system protein
MHQQRTSSPRRAYIQITELGQAFLASGKDTLTVDTLKKYEDFQTFIDKTPNESADNTAAVVNITSQIKTPQEILEDAIAEMQQALAQELLETIKSCSPDFFERLVVDLLVSMGYGGSRREAGQVVGGSSDGGIDGIIKEDKLGLDTIYFQAKRWEGTVGRPEIQRFVGAL